jgi:hypothetical protein
LECHQHFSQKILVRITKTIVQLENATTKRLAMIKKKYIRLVAGDLLNTASSSLTPIEGRTAFLDSGYPKSNEVDTQTRAIRDALRKESRGLHSLLKVLKEPVC